MNDCNLLYAPRSNQYIYFVTTFVMSMSVVNFIHEDATWTEGVEKLREQLTISIPCMYP